MGHIQLEEHYTIDIRITQDNYVKRVYWHIKNINQKIISNEEKRKRNNEINQSNM